MAIKSDKDVVEQIKNKKYIDGLHSVHGHKHVVGLAIGFKGKQLLLKENIS